MICLDTNVVNAILNGRPPVVRVRLREALADGERIAISAVVVFELRYGADRSVRPDRNHARIDNLLAGPLEVLPFTEKDAAGAGAVRAHLAGQGMQIGPFDVLIAGQAKAHDLPIVTVNVREFDRVPGLTVRNWEAT